MKFFSPLYWFFKFLAILKASLVLCAEEEEPPTHYFSISEQIIRSGKLKGNVKYVVNLVLPPYLFKRKVDAPSEGKRATFACIRCETEGHNLYAKCVKNFSGEPKPSYTLLSWPNTESHKCLPSPSAHLIKKFMDSIYASLRTKPWMSVAGLYKHERTLITNTLDDDEKIVFLSEIPKWRSCNANFYRFRNQFIPKQPSTPVS